MVSVVDVVIKPSKRKAQQIALEMNKEKNEKILCPWQQSVVDGNTILGKNEWNGEKGEMMGRLNEDIVNFWVEDVEEGLTLKGLDEWYRTGI